MPDFALNFSPLWAEPSPIPFHAVVALSALVLGAVQLVGAKGTTIHRRIGTVWVLLMLGTALSALFIHAIQLWGPFSPIHLLIPVTLIGLWQAVAAARRGNIRLHKLMMASLYGLALVVTGLFTLLPNRVMHAVVFAG